MYICDLKYFLMTRTICYYISVSYKVSVFLLSDYSAINHANMYFLKYLVGTVDKYMIFLQCPFQALSLITDFFKSE